MAQESWGASNMRNAPAGTQRPSATLADSWLLKIARFGFRESKQETANDVKLGLFKM